MPDNDWLQGAIPLDNPPAQAGGNDWLKQAIPIGTPSTPSPTDATGKALFLKPNDVEKYLGIKYKFGGECAKGIDCSAFTQQLYARNGVSGLPRTAQEQWSSNRGQRITSYGDIKPGDQLFFQGSRLGGGQAGHTAYFAGWDTDKSGVTIPMMYAASSAAKSVVKQRLDDFLHSSGQTFLGAKRYAEFQKAGTTQQSIGTPGAAPTPDHLPLVDPRQVQAQYDKFLSKPNDSIPQKVAARLASVDSTQRAADPQLLKMNPNTQAAILRKAHELAATPATDPQIADYKDRFLISHRLQGPSLPHNPETGEPANAPARIAARLLNMEPEQRANDAQLKKLSPVGQRAILDRVSELDTPAIQELRRGNVSALMNVLPVSVQRQIANMKPGGLKQAAEVASGLGSFEVRF